MHKTLEYIKTEKMALRLIARAEQCSSGLIRKLEKRGCDPACINEVVSNLFEKKLLDDKRFARLWLHSKIRFAKSPRRLLSSLCARGIDHDDAEAALKEVLGEENTEFTMLEKYVNKHAKKAVSKNCDTAKSLKYLLKSEGFSLAAIQRFIGDEE